MPTPESFFNLPEGEDINPYLRQSRLSQMARGLKPTLDPALRASLLNNINSPYKSNISRQAINPFTDTAKWGKQTWENIQEPVRDLWNSKKWYGKPLAIASEPLQILGAPITGLTTALGYKHASSGYDVGLQYAADPSVSLPAAAAITLGGTLLDQLGPGYHMKFGPTPIAKIGEDILHEGVGIQGIKDAAKAEELARTTRHATEFSRENIRNIAAPGQMYKHFQALPTEVKHSNLGLDTLEHAFGEKKTEAIPGLKYTYNELLTSARNKSADDLKRFEAFPNHIINPNSDEGLRGGASTLENNLQALANHQAYIEEAMYQGRRGTRVYGVRLGPSIPKAVSDIASNALGRWVVPDVTKAIKASVPEDRWASIQRFFTDRGLPIDENANMHHFFQSIDRIQGAMPKNVGHAGMLGDMELMKPWIRNELQGKKGIDRLTHLEDIKNIYQTAHEFLKANPKVVTSAQTHNVGKGLRTLEGWVNDIKSKPPTELEGFSSEIANKLIPHKAVGEFALQQTETRIKDTLKNMLELSQQQKSLSKSAKTLPEFIAKSVLPPGVGSTYDIAHQANKLFEDYNRLLDLKAPAPYTSQWRQFKMETNKALESFQNILANHEDYLNEALMGKTELPTHGLAVYNKLLKSHHEPFWKESASKLGAPSHVTTDAATPIENVEDTLNGLRDKLIKDIPQDIGIHYTPEEAAQMTSELSKMNHEDLRNMFHGFADLAHSKADGSIRAAMMEKITDKFKPIMQELHKTILTDSDRNIRDFMSGMDQFQAYYEPRKGVGWLMKTGGLVDRLNQAAQSAFIKHGFSPLLPEIMKHNVLEKESIPTRATDYAMNDISRDIILKEFKSITPHRLGRINKATESAINEAVYDPIQMKHALTRIDREMAVLRASKAIDADTLEKLGRLEAQKNTATQRMVQGRQNLAKYIGDEGSVDRFINNVETKLRDHLDAARKEEFARGDAGVYRQNYFPYYLKGKPKDVEAFTNLKYGLDVNSEIPDSQQRVLSTLGTQERRRHFPDAAAVQHFINEINAMSPEERMERFLLDRPLDINVGSNAAEALGERKASILRTQNNRDTVARMRAALPPSMVTMHIGKPGEGLLRNLDLVNLGTLIPKMENHWVPRALYTYVSHFIPPARQESFVFDTIHKLSDWLAKLSVRYSFGHAKNIGSLALTGGQNLREVTNVLDSAGRIMNNAEKVHPEYDALERLTRAIKLDKDYEKMTSHGVTHFEPEKFGKSVSEIINQEMQPQKSRLKGLVLGGEASPIQGATFGVMDPAVKLGMFKDLKRQGLTDTQASEWVNHYLIDYSTRTLKPEVRRYLHAVMPYGGYRIGNMMLQIPNMIENPGKYALINHLRHYVSDNVWHSTPYNHDKYTDALADAIYLPMRNKEGNQMTAFLDLPQDQYQQLLRRTVGNSLNPFSYRAEAVNYILNHTRWAPMLRDALVRRKSLGDETFSESLLGKKGHPGYLQSVSWGLQAPIHDVKDLYAIMRNPSKWANIGPDVINNLIRLDSINGAGKPQGTF